MVNFCAGLGQKRRENNTIIMDSKAINIYLEDLIKEFKPYAFTERDRKLINKDEIEFVTNKLIRKKFRKHKVAKKTEEDIRNKVKKSFRENIPIYLTVPFGGYKHFWNHSYPVPDWAEIFTFNHLYNFVSPLLEIYKPGVVIEFISEDLILTRMNNYPPEALNSYSRIFSSLIEKFNSWSPENFQLKFFRIGDQCDKDKMVEKVEKLLNERRGEFFKLSEENKQKELKRSHRSVMYNGYKDLTKLSSREKLDREIDSRIIELAYYDTEAESRFLGDYLWRDNHICICFSFGLSHDNIDNFLTLGSCKSSIVDYWIGRGILEAHGNKIIPRIVSKTQYETIKNDLKMFNTRSVLPSNNFGSIEVLNKIFA